MWCVRVKKVLIVPLTTMGVLEYLDNLAVRLKDILEESGVSSEVTVWPSTLRPNMKCFDWNRLQYHAACVLKHIRDHFQQLGIVRDYYIVGVGYLDAYEQGLNFVFGEASILYGVCAVFTKRLKPEFYGGRPDYNLYFERVVKEVVHELGHLFGLEHCPNHKCVMRFSNSIVEVDEKTHEFCPDCKRKLSTASS